MSLNAELPRVAMDDQGNAVAVWAQINNATNLHEIFSSLFSSPSDTWSTPIAISTNTKNSNMPKLAVSKSTGNAVAIWYSTDSTGANSIEASQFTFSSGTWSTPAILAQTTSTENPYPDLQVFIADDADNTMVAIWTALSDGKFDNFTAHAILGGPWSSP